MLTAYTRTPQSKHMKRPGTHWPPPLRCASDTHTHTSTDTDTFCASVLKFILYRSGPVVGISERKHIGSIRGRKMLPKPNTHLPAHIYVCVREREIERERECVWVCLCPKGPQRRSRYRSRIMQRLSIFSSRSSGPFAIGLCVGKHYSKRLQASSFILIPVKRNEKLGLAHTQPHSHTNSASFTYFTMMVGIYPQRRPSPDRATGLRPMAICIATGQEATVQENLWWHAHEIM